MSNYWKQKLKELEEEEKKKSSGNSSNYWENKLEELEKKPVVESKPVRDIAPVVTPKDEEERGWFQSGAFEDGYQFGDILRSVSATATDITQGIQTGVLKIGEGVIDAGAGLIGGVGKLFGNDEFAEDMTRFAEKDLISEEKISNFLTNIQGGWAHNLLNGNTDITSNEGVEKASFAGDKIDSLAESGGQLLGTIGLQSVGVPWYLTTGATSFGSEFESAAQQGASYEDAALSAVITAGAELLTEKIFGGSGLGEKGLINLEPLTKGISNKVVKTLADFGIDMLAEGSEEVLSGAMSAVGQKLSYADEKELNELFSSEDAWESFIGGAVLGGGANVVNVGNSIKTGRDYRTKLTTNEQKVFDQVYNDRLAEAEQNGTELTKKEKAAIYDEVMEDLEKGAISTDTIESVLGGETYKTYQDTINNEDALIKEYEELRQMKKGEMNDIQQDRLAELKAMNLTDTTKRDSLKSQLSEEVQKQLVRQTKSGTQADNYLIESYNERVRKSQSFQADVNQYKNENAKKTAQNALDFVQRNPDAMHNGREAHDFIDFCVKIAEDKGKVVDFTITAEMEQSIKNGNPDNLKANPKYIEAYNSESGNKMVVNMDVDRSLPSLVGHEITDMMRGAKAYDALQKAAFSYAETKGELETRRTSIENRYKNVEADLDGELTSDLCGDYLFTDSEFVRHLSANHRNVFQKIFDEIKHLCKLATAGSKEARQLEKLKHEFEKVWRDNAKSDSEASGTNYSLAESETSGKNYNLGIDNQQNLVYNGARGDTYARTDEFRNLQEESRRMSEEELQGYHRGDRTPDDLVRRRLSRVLSRQVGAVRGGNRYDNGLLKLSDSKGNQYNIYEGVNGELFHDCFEISRQYLKNGELVDLHTVETTDDGIGYNDCYNYLSEDGLSGFSITPDGDLISVFNASGKNGFLRAISDIVKSKAKTLDCYASPNQNLMAMYEKVFGFKAASVMDYNMEYDHDNIAENHNYPKVAFMVNSDSDVETKSFTQDQYNEAVEYRNSFVHQATSDKVAYFMPENSGSYSLTKEGETHKQYGDFNIYAKDLRVAPMQEDVAPVSEDVSKMETPTENTTPEGFAPTSEAEANALQSENIESLTDADAPSEAETPYYEPSSATPKNPFESRDYKQVGNRTVKAYMYENPEVKPFFQAEAEAMLGDLERSTKGERWYNDELYYESNGEQGYSGTKRHTTDDIAYLLDSGYTYEQIENALNAIINTDGEKLNACGKRIEFLLNDRLMKGYQDVDGYDIPANQEYINLLNQKQTQEAYQQSAEAEIFTDADAPIADIAPVEESIETPIAEQYEAIKPKREPNTEPRLKRVKDSEDSAAGKQRKWIGTSTESEAVDGKILPEDLHQEAIHYQPISNKKTLNDANTKLNGMGYEASVAYFNSQFANKKTTVEDIVLGERLIQEAIKRGDNNVAGELIQNVAILGTELGQKVQALSIIKRLTPEGQLGMLRKTIERGKTKGDKAYEGVELTQEMIDHILKTYGKDGTYDQKKLNKAVEDVKQKIADQMKVTKMEKANAWRYLSMLGNPKTHIRNLVSNVAMRGTLAVKNAVARTIEDIAPVKNRTKTWKAASNEVKTFAEKTVIEMKDVLSDGGKYNEEASIKEKRQIFKNNVLNKVYNLNSELLSKEDWWFSKPAFKNALQEYLTANGISTAEDIKNNPKVIAKAKQYATEQSQIATFRQYSWLANKINEIEHKNTATSIAVGAVLPFKKTPINIAKTALNYSPLGFTKTLTYDISQVKNGNMEASELVDHLSQNVTGTALTLIGYMLASAGFLNGAGEDDKEGEYDYQLGEQSYSVNIGGATFSLSWLSPIAMPLFVGANAYEQLVEGKEWNGDVVMETMAQTLDPLSEMSFLSSLDSVLSSYDSGIQKFAGIAQSAGQSYVSQFVPTLSSQLASTLDDTKRTTKVAADSDFKFVDETINSLKYKIPFLRQTLEPTTDIWGNEVKQSENLITRAVESFIAPYAKRDDITTQIDETIKGLYAQTGDDGVIPSIPYNYVNYDGEKYEMSAEEFTAYKKTYGQTAYGLMKELFNTSTYRFATDEEKAEMVNKVYDYARDEAKRKFFAKRDIDFTNATSKGIEYYKVNSIVGAVENNVTVDEFDFAYENPEKYAFLHKKDISFDDFKNANESAKEAYDWAFKNQEKIPLAEAVADDVVAYRKYTSELYDIEADKDEDGKSIRGSRKDKVIDWLNEQDDMDYGKRLILFKSEYPADDTYNEDIIEYLNSREDISYKDMVSILRELGFTVDDKGNITWD